MADSIKNKRKSNAQVSYKPTPYLKKAIADAERDYAEGKTQMASSIDELIRELRS